MSPTDYTLLRRQRRDHFLRHNATPFSTVSTYRYRAERAADAHERKYWLGLARAALDLKREHRIAKVKAKGANALSSFLSRLARPAVTRSLESV